MKAIFNCLISFCLVSVVNSTEAPTKAPTKSPGVITDLVLVVVNAQPGVERIYLNLDTVNTIILEDFGLPLDTQFNVDAISDGGLIDKVKFDNDERERNSPYARCGNRGDDFKPCDDLKLGANVVITAKSFIGPQETSMVSATVHIGTTAPTKSPTTAIPTTDAPTKSPGVITDLALVNADNESERINLLIAGINNINLYGCGWQNTTGFSVEAISDGGLINKVLFDNGEIEKNAPYARCGNSGANFRPCDDLVLDQSFAITATALDSEGNEISFASASLEISFDTNSDQCFLPPCC